MSCPVEPISCSSLWRLWKYCTLFHWKCQNFMGQFMGGFMGGQDFRKKKAEKVKGVKQK